MNGGNEPVLHALAVEPRLARPGDTLRVRFRTTNLGAVPSPPGTLVFRLPAGVEALDETQVPVAPVLPGQDVLAEIRARVEAPRADAEPLRFEAVFELSEAQLCTNVCTVTVRSAPCIDGPDSGIFVEPVDRDTIRVRAVIVNAGDGPARALRVVIPPPPGTVRVDGPGPEIRDVDGLDAGERLTLAFDARIVAPSGTISGEDAYVAFSDGTRRSIAARNAVTLAPALTAPAIALSASRRRVDVAIEVCNDGWLDACDVPLRVSLPAGLRPMDGTLYVDGSPLTIPARRPNAGAALTIALDRVAARETVRVSFAAFVPIACPDVVVRAALEEHAAIARCVPVTTRDLRVRAVDAPRTIAAGACATIVMHLVNGGDAPERVRVAATGPLEIVRVDGPARALAPGAAAAAVIVVRAPAGTVDDACLPIALALRDDDGERARADVTLTVRNRAWLHVAEAPRRDEGGGVCYVVRNAGSTTAHDLVVQNGDDVRELAPLAPGASVAFSITEPHDDAAIVAAGCAPVPLPPLDRAAPARIFAAVDAPETSLAGAPFTITAAFAPEDDVERLVIRAAAPDGARYVSGSTRIDGRALLDRAQQSPLAERGLTLHAVPAGTRIVLAWTLLADPSASGEHVAVTVEYDADGARRSIVSRAIAIRPRDAFGVRPAGLPYHVDACTADLAQERSAADAPVAPALPPSGTPLRGDTIVVGFPASPERLAEIARLLRGTEQRQLVAHVLALRALFPDEEMSGSAVLGDALAGARDALRDVFDRLFVKLRIPGFAAVAEDLEDGDLRRSLIALFDRCLDADAPVPGDDAEADGIVTARLTTERVRALLAGFADGPYGAPDMLRALVALVPTRCDDEPLLAAALARYTGVLDAELARLQNASAAAFDDALGEACAAALDDARAALLAAIRACLATAGAA